MNQSTRPQQPAPPAKKPNETGSISVEGHTSTSLVLGSKIRMCPSTGSISVEGHIRIFDPKTKEVLVEKRA